MEKVQSLPTAPIPNFQQGFCPALPPLSDPNFACSCSSPLLLCLLLHRRQNLSLLLALGLQVAQLPRKASSSPAGSSGAEHKSSAPRTAFSQHPWTKYQLLYLNPTTKLSTVSLPPQHIEQPHFLPALDDVTWRETLTCSSAEKPWQDGQQQPHGSSHWQGSSWPREALKPSGLLSGGQRNVEVLQVLSC